jgi:hypothetical protein
VVHPFNGILLSLREGRNSESYSMDEPERHDAK